MPPKKRQTKKRAKEVQYGFKWNANKYKLEKTIHNGVEVHKNTDTNVIIVKKVIKVDIGFTPRELMFLQLLPRCNRVVGMLGFEMGNPDKKSCSLFFEWYPLGDIRDWRKREFVQRNNKPVPETYIWRFLIQMSQALAFIHKGLGTVIKPWRKIIHRDIKPDNILVVDNGTTYPSFRLSDFGVSKQMKRGDARESTAGTHVWQPPELPLINTPAADIWSVGAVVHFIALGRAPVDNIDEYRNRVLEKLNGDYPASYERAKSADRTQYWRVKVPRKVTSINVSPEKQYAERTKFDGGNVDPRSFNTQYSDRLNFWMHQCLTTNSRRRVTTDALLRDMVPDAEAIIHKMAGKAGLVDLDMVVEGPPKTDDEASDEEVGERAPKGKKTTPKKVAPKTMPKKTTPKRKAPAEKKPVQGSKRVKAAG